MKITWNGDAYRKAEDAELEIETYTHEAPLKRWTCLCDTPEEPGPVEEIDVDARTRREARQVCDAAIEKDYLEGLRVKVIEGPKLGLYL